jgi:SAM-dependent methyltransferase
MTTVLHASDGPVIPLEVDRWRAEPDTAERQLLDTVADPVLDIGCGPGRIAAALAAQGRIVLGIDPSPYAIAEAQRRGAPVLRRSVFASLPAEGRWASALLLDGNVGIGGDPTALLARVARLLRPAGEIVIEVAPPGTPTDTLTVQVRRAGLPLGPRFPWARVAVGAIDEIARRVGLTSVALDVRGGRWFARARR